MLMSAFRIFAIPALHVWHPTMAKAVTGWGHTAVGENADECVRDWHRGEQGNTSIVGESSRDWEIAAVRAPAPVTSLERS